MGARHLLLFRPCFLVVPHSQVLGVDIRSYLSLTFQILLLRGCTVTRRQRVKSPTIVRLLLPHCLVCGGLIIDERLREIHPRVIDVLSSSRSNNWLEWQSTGVHPRIARGIHSGEVFITARSCTHRYSRSFAHPADHRSWQYTGSCA
jgi:hypothetical protein